MHGSVERGGNGLEKCLVFNVRPHWLQLLRQVNELEFGPLAVAGLEVLWNNALKTRALNNAMKIEPQVSSPRTTASASLELRASSQT